MNDLEKTMLCKNLFIVVDELICYGKEHGVRFNEKGFPIFEKEHFLNSLGKYMLPYSHRNDTPDKRETIVCFYEPDKLLYGRLTLKKLRQIAEILKSYKGFVGFDLSIFKDFLYPFQEFYILANLVISMFFALEGNKMIPNLRADQTGGESYFGLFKDAPLVCCGTLGCSRENERKLINIKEIDEYCDNHPNQLVIQYGSNLSKKNNTYYFKSYGRKEKRNNG